jgi:hypothetical protein
VARAALATARLEPASAAELARVMEPLGRARSALAEGGSDAADALEPATEWIAWSVRAIGAHRQWAERLPSAPGATLRELASQSAEAARLVLGLEAIAERAYR